MAALRYGGVQSSYRPTFAELVHSDYFCMPLLHVAYRRRGIVEDSDRPQNCRLSVLVILYTQRGGSVAEWLAWWTQAQKGLGSNRSRDIVG